MASRLTRAQRSANEAIIQTLEAAGWQTTDRGRAFGVADLEHETDSVSLYVGYRYRSESIGLKVTDKAARKAARFSIEFGERLPDLLRVFVAWSAKVSAENYRDMMEDVVHVCPETYLIQGADGEVRTKVEPSKPAAST